MQEKKAEKVAGAGAGRTNSRGRTEAARMRATAVRCDGGVCGRVGRGKAGKEGSDYG